VNRNVTSYIDDTTESGITYVYRVDAFNVLKVGATTTTVEVSATVGADLQTTNATVGNTLTSEALMLLPNMGRDVSTLAVLQHSDESEYGLVEPEATQA